MKSTHLAILCFTASISKVFQGSMRIFSKKLPHPDLVGVLWLNHLSSLESLSLLFFGIDSTLGTVALVLASNKSIESMRGDQYLQCQIQEILLSCSLQKRKKPYCLRTSTRRRCLSPPSFTWRWICPPHHSTKMRRSSSLFLRFLSSTSWPSSTETMRRCSFSLSFFWFAFIIYFFRLFIFFIIHSTFWMYFFEEKKVKCLILIMLIEVFSWEMLYTLCKVKFICVK